MRSEEQELDLEGRVGICEELDKPRWRVPGGGALECEHRDGKVSLMFVRGLELAVTERRACVGDRAAERDEHDAGGEAGLGRESSDTSLAEGCPFLLFVVFSFLKALGVK